ncbi:MAG: SMC-Scp complex subunit ScpB [Candidatus Bathyarchaeia archaeon]
MSELSEADKIALIEASLYVTGRPLTVKTIASTIGLRSEAKVRELTRRLIKRYEETPTALQIVEMNDGRFIMQLKPQYAEPVKKLVKKKVLSKGPLRTLAFIAFKQPVTQAYVCKVRGKPAYHHIRQLKDMGFVVDEKLGRTSVIRTTETFADYFNLSHNLKVMKKQLQSLFLQNKGTEEWKSDDTFILQTTGNTSSQGSSGK